MKIDLKPDQEAWLRTLVASGDFASIEDAAHHIIDEHRAGADLEDDDMAWARAYVDEAREAVARGEVMTLDEHRARNAKRLAALRK